VSVILRMKRMGSHKRPFYRVVAADSRNQRDGRFLEILGYYDPMKTPYTFVVDREKVLSWLQNGARMSETVESLLRKQGVVQEYHLAKQKPAASAESAPAESAPAVE
jgi:small subunit ribosomal protein S16